MRLLLDTNIFLEVILEQEKAQEVLILLSKTEAHEFFISDYSLHSIGLLLFRKNQPEVFKQFLVDIFHNVGLRLGALSVEEMERILQPARQFNLDFDDAYQYTLADCYDLIIVSFDADFDRTNRGRKTPSEV